MLDRLDRRIIRVLQLSPRIPFRAAAASLGVSEPTVARRYARLHADGVIRILGVPDPWIAGQHVRVMRIACSPQATSRVAQALAERDDVSWVMVDASDAEITCAVRSLSSRERDDLLLQRLPQSSAVTGIRGAVVLEQFTGGRLHHQDVREDLLTPEEETRVRAFSLPTQVALVAGAVPVREFDAADRSLIATLAADGRASIARLARAASIAPGPAGRRLARLLAEGAAEIDVDVIPAAFGLGLRANIWVRVTPSSLRMAGLLAAELPQMIFVAAVTGPDNLFLSLLCQDYAELYDLLTGRLATLPGVLSMDSDPVTFTYKQSRSRVVQGRLTP